MFGVKLGTNYSRGWADKLRSFKNARGGNIAMMFGLMVPVMFLFIGGAVDFTRRNSVHAEIIESLDAASLAMRRYQVANPDKTDTELEEFARNFFYENFDYENELAPGWAPTFQVINNVKIAGCVNGRLNTYLLRVVDINYFDISDCVGITIDGNGRLELSLVLDVTGSMNRSAGGERKIKSLRDAVSTMNSILFGGEAENENVKIGIVPFNAFTNPGGTDVWGENPDWTDRNAEAVYHGARFFHVDYDGTINMEKKVNHFDLFDSNNRMNWMGCVESRPYPLDELDTVPGEALAFPEGGDYSSIINYIEPLTVAEEPNERVRQAFDRAPDINAALTASDLEAEENSRWVPLFRGDEVDCPNNNAYCRGNWGLQTFSGWANGVYISEQVEGAYFQNPEDEPNTDFLKNRYRSYTSDYNYSGKANNDNPNVDHLRYYKTVNDWRRILNTPDGSLNDNELAFKEFSRNHLGATDRDDQEYRLRGAYVGWYRNNANAYYGKYENTVSIDEVITDSNDSMRGPNNGCPAPILPLTSTKKDITDHMTLLHPAGFTNIPNGLVWGWRTLSPQAPFTEGVGPDDPEYSTWKKAIVLMTDGDNTAEFGSNTDSTHWGSVLLSYGYALEERMGDGVNLAHRPNGSPGSSLTPLTDMRDQMDEKLLRICKRIKDEGIEIYTILFDVNENSDTAELFRTCATEPGGDYFHIAPDGVALEEAFAGIAANLVKLHVSK